MPNPNTAQGIVQLFPPPSALTVSLHKELERNSTLSSLPIQDRRNRQLENALEFFDRGMEQRETYIDEEGTIINRRVLVKLWMNMKTEAIAWSETETLKEKEGDERTSGKGDQTESVGKRDTDSVAGSMGPQQGANNNLNNVTEETFSLDVELHKLIVSNKSQMLRFCQFVEADDEEDRERKAFAKAVLDKVWGSRDAELEKEEAMGLGWVLGGLGLVGDAGEE